MPQILSIRGTSDGMWSYNSPILGPRLRVAKVWYVVHKDWCDSQSLSRPLLSYKAGSSWHVAERDGFFP
jgi:hypothetical protein